MALTIIKPSGGGGGGGGGDHPDSDHTSFSSKTALQAEETARINADAAEQAARIAADTAEQNARVSADSTLTTLINGKQATSSNLTTIANIVPNSAKILSGNFTLIDPPSSGSPASHPTLAEHDALGLATQAELVAHAALPHGATVGVSKNIGAGYPARGAYDLVFWLGPDPPPAGMMADGDIYYKWIPSNSDTTPPAVPGGLTATRGNTLVNLSWNGVTDPDLAGYKIYRDGLFLTNVTGATTYQDTILANGTTYSYRIASFDNSGNVSSQSGAVTATPATTPSQPDTPVAVAGNAQATVTWVAPDNGGDPISSYTLTPYIGGVAQSLITGITDTSYVVNGLTNGTTYTFSVKAINSVGTGPDSNQSNAVTPTAAATAPAQVSPAPTVAGGNQQVTVTWTQPANGGSAITNYRITPFIGSTAQTPITVGNVLTHTVTGLVNGTTYTFRVAAINNVGTGPDSPSSVDVTPSTVPGAPTGVSATGGVGSATVNWTPPASNGGSAITEYRVTTTGTGAPAPQTFAANATSGTITGLTNGNSYTFTVAARNTNGYSAESVASNSVTPADAVPNAPTIGTAQGGDTQATANWTAPSPNGGSAITGYTVKTYRASDNVVLFTDAVGSVLTFTKTGLTNGTAIYFKVAATNNAGTGAESAASNTVTPSAPVNATPTHLTTGTSTTDTTSYTTASITVPGGQTSLLAVTYGGTVIAAGNPPTISQPGVTWEHVVTAADGQVGAVYLFRCAPSASQTGQITITWSSTRTGAGWSTVTIANSRTGGNGADALGTPAIAVQGSGTSISTTIPTLANTRSAALGFLKTGAASPVVGSGYTLLGSSNLTDPGTSASEWRQGVTLVDWATVAGVTRLIGIEVKAV